MSLEADDGNVARPKAFESADIDSKAATTQQPQPDAADDYVTDIRADVGGSDSCEYLHGLSLFLTTAALMLSMFIVRDKSYFEFVLVPKLNNPIAGSPRYGRFIMAIDEIMNLAISGRVSWLQPFRKSPQSSTVYRLWVGMRLHSL